MRLAIPKIELTHLAAAVLLVALVVFSVRAVRVTTVDESETATENHDETASSAAELGRYEIVQASWRQRPEGEGPPAVELTPPVLSAEELAERARLQKIGEDLQGIPIAVEKQ